MNEISASGSDGSRTHHGGECAHRTGSLRRSWPLMAGAVVLIVASSTGGAVASRFITSADIKDRTIQSRDLATNAVNARAIKAGSVQAGDLTTAARAALKGQPGAPGSRWLTGVGVPGNLAANDGDWYLDTAVQGLYTRLGGAWGFVVTLGGSQGAKGDPGAPGAPGAPGVKGDKGENGAAGINGTNGADGKAGSAWLSGTAVPTGTMGVVGDWYLNTTTSDAFQKTDATTWVLRVNLKGIQGEKGDKGDAGTNGAAGTNGTNGTNGDDGLDGATWLVGTGVPLNTLGKDTDLYLNTATSDVYRKTSGTWSLLTNIKGQKGDPGTNGVDGTNGIDGANGAAGANGTNGTTWLTGAGAPSLIGPGVTNDLYLNTTNGDVYKRGVASWGTPIANLTGPAGADGSGGGGGTSWSSGAGAPDPGTVNPAAGAFYLNTTNGAIYKADGTAWTLLYTPSAGADTFPNVQLDVKATTSQTFPQIDVTDTTIRLNYSAANNPQATLTGGNTWDGNTFTVGSTGAGWYEIRAGARGVSSTGTISSNQIHLFLDIDNAMGNTATGSFAGSTVMLNTSSTTIDSRNTTLLNRMVYLNAGQTVQIQGVASSTTVDGYNQPGDATYLQIVRTR